jgi:hypothetical protein
MNERPSWATLLVITKVDERRLRGGGLLIMFIFQKGVRERTEEAVKIAGSTNGLKRIPNRRNSHTFSQSKE